MRLDFSLAAGLLSASPRSLSAVVSPGGTQTLTLDVTNTGTGDGSFVLHEVDVPPPAELEPVFASLEDQRAARRAFPTAGFSGVGAKPAGPLPNAPTHTAPTAGAGNVVFSFATGLSDAWGMAYDTDADRLWVCNPDAPQAQLFGDGLDYQFQPDGVQTGETIDLGAGWQGDGTYNARTGMIWHTDVAFTSSSPNQCLFEIDPVTKVVTGNQICGPWTNFPGLTGLAYDYVDRHLLRGRPARCHHPRRRRRQRPRLGEHRAPDLGPGVQSHDAPPLRADILDPSFRHLGRDPR